MRSSSITRRVAVGLFTACSLVAAGCGDDESSDSTAAAPAATEATGATEAVTETTAVPTDAVATTEAAPATTGPAATEAPTTVAGFDGDLVGTFALAAGDCASGAATGSWFQMVQPGGNAADGPFIPNGDSTCADTNFTLLVPGTDGGLTTGSVQTSPDPAFDAAGNGLAAGVFQPVTFFGVALAGAFDATGATPTVSAVDGPLTADLSAFTAYYGGGTFNQGAPKPDGTGDAAVGSIGDDGSFVLEWTSLIAGGSFDGFTGVWHLEGTFSAG